MSLSEEYPNTDLEMSKSGKAPRPQPPDAPINQLAKNSSRRQPIPPHRPTAGHGRGRIRPRLIPLALTALMVCSVVLTSPASASSAAGKRRSSDQIVGRPQPNRALARLVLSPAWASIRASARQYYHAEGYDAAGHDLGDLTAQTSFSIHPDGSCAGASCTATKTGRHTITGAVHQGHRAISAMAALEVVAPPSPVEPSHHPVQPSRHSVRPPRDPVDASHHPVSPSRRSVEGSGRPVRPSRGLDPPSRRPVELGRGRVEPSRNPAASPRHQAERPQPLALLKLDPTRAFISPGERLTYTAWLTTPDRSPLNVTDQARFSIRFSAAKTSRHIHPEGSCTGAICTATKLGRHTVTGSLDLGDSIISGTAALQVVPRRHGVGRPHQPFRELILDPVKRTILLGEGQTYTAWAVAADNSRHNVTARTTFTIGPDGSCTANTCSPAAVGEHTVIGTFPQRDGDLTGTAILLVVQGPLVRLVIGPSTATIRLGDGKGYTATGFTADNSPVDVTDVTTFTFEQKDGAPSGSCPNATCRPPEAGTYVITGTFTQSTGPSPLTASATLLVRSPPPPVVIERLELRPPTATIDLGLGQSYLAIGHGSDGNDYPVTARTTFTFQNQKPGSPVRSCIGNICDPPERGTYTITGTFTQQAGSTLKATATLLVVDKIFTKLQLTPERSTILVDHGGQDYIAIATTTDGSTQVVTAATTFTFKKKGTSTSVSCTGATCSPSEVGEYIVIGTLTQQFGLTLKAEATLLVPPPPSSVVIERLELRPPTATIQLPDSQSYIAIGHGSDSKEYNVTAGTTFAFEQKDGAPSGSCPGGRCAPPEPGEYTITGTFTQPAGPSPLIARATLLVLSPAVVIERLELHPKPNPAVIQPGGKVTYTVHGLDASGNHLDQLGDLAPFTHFEIDGGGTCTGATCTATKLGPHTVTATLDLGNRNVIGKATLHVAAAPPNCTPSASDVRGFQVTPSKAVPGTKLHIMAKISGEFVACPLILRLGGSNLGGDATVGPDGSISEFRTVPDNAKPGTTTVRLATTDGRILAETSFEVLPKIEAAVVQPAGLGLPWLLLLVLLLVLTVLATLGERERRQRRWARQHVRAEPHPSSDEVTVDQDPQSAPTFSLRLQPYGDAGTQTMEERD